MPIATIQVRYDLTEAPQAPSRWHPGAGADTVPPMTGRSVAEWIGRTPDTAAPPRVRVRVFDREGGKCHHCTRKIPVGEQWTLEHVKALVNGGENRERNLAVTCGWCLPGKNAEDVAEKARVYRKRAKHVGAAGPKRGFWQHPTLKRTVDGRIVPR